MTNFENMKHDVNYDVIVVGAGISGILTALALTKEGKKVLLLEKSDVLGGNCRTYTIQGYSMDTGPHAVTKLEDDGPLRILMEQYFNEDINFIPIGSYYARDGQKLLDVPVSIGQLLNFSIISKKDRLLLLTAMLDAVASSSFPNRKQKLKMSVYDYIKKYNLSPKSMRFLDTISYFLSGKSMHETPTWRMLGGSGFLDEGRNAHIQSKNHLEKIKQFAVNTYHTQGYPSGGIQVITDTALNSMPKDKITIQNKEEVLQIKQDKSLLFNVKTTKNSYTAQMVVYSGFVKDLPQLFDGLSAEYVHQLAKLQQTRSMCLWLGLKKVMPELSYLGSEVFFNTDTPYWAIPVSNLDPNLAPKNKQLIGFSTVMKESDEAVQLQKLKKTIYKALPGIKELIEFEHLQITIPEKAAVTTNVQFPSPKTPITGLYVVGTDTDMRSMGLTRASHSVVEVLKFMRQDGYL